MKDIQANMSSAKTFNEQNTNEYIHYILCNSSASFSFYKPATLRFHNCQGRHKANTEVYNILLNGGKNLRTKR